MSYIKGIDGLRAIAVGLVLWHHWIPEGHWLHTYPTGPLGVNLFFVISGFLISRILFEQKARVDRQEISAGKMLWRFMARRALRIFPIYYLAILFFALTESYTKTFITQDLGYYLTYTSNYLFYIQNDWNGIVSHTWSLAVEEQFYLVWPLLILLIPLRRMPALIGIVTLIGFIFPYLIDSYFENILTPATFLAFGIGAALAWALRKAPERLSRMGKWRWPLAISAFALSMIPWGSELLIPLRFSHSIFGVCLIHFCMFPPSGSRILPFFVHPWTVWIGQISYGIYLFHLPVRRYWELLCQKSGPLEPILNPDLWPVRFIYYLGITLILAWLSWRWIEAPILRLKQKVAY